MNQQLTVSKELVNYFSKYLPAFKENDAIKTVEFIDQNFIVTDNKIKHFNNIVDAIEAIQDEKKKSEIQKIFTHWIQERKCLVECDYKDDSESEIKLAASSEDKIYFNPTLKADAIKRYAKRYSEIELHNIKSFVNPESFHKLKHIPSTIPLEKGVYYDLQKILDPFLRSSENILIEDPYLPNTTASYNFLKIIENFRHQNIKLVFLTRSKYAEHSVYDKFIEKLKALNNDGYQINFSNHFRKKIHRERYLFTDDFQIYFPGGFDLLETDGFLRNDFNSNVDERKEIRIEKRKFAIKF